MLVSHLNQYLFSQRHCILAVLRVTITYLRTQHSACYKIFFNALKLFHRDAHTNALGYKARIFNANEINQFIYAICQKRDTWYFFLRDILKIRHLCARLVLNLTWRTQGWRSMSIGHIGADGGAFSAVLCLSLAKHAKDVCRGERRLCNTRNPFEEDVIVQTRENPYNR